MHTFCFNDFYFHYDYTRTFCVHSLINYNRGFFISNLSCCDWPIINTKTIKIHKIFHIFKKYTLNTRFEGVYLVNIWSDRIRWEYSILNHVNLSYLKLCWILFFQNVFSTIKLKIKIIMGNPILPPLFLNLIRKKGWIEKYRKNRK